MREAGQAKSRGSVSWLLVAGGAAILSMAALSYGSGLSRSGAVVMAPVGAALLAVGGVAVARGGPVNRLVLAILVAIVVTLLGLGVATWIYAQLHQPTGA